MIEGLMKRAVLVENLDPDAPGEQNIEDAIKFTIAKTQENC